MPIGFKGGAPEPKTSEESKSAENATEAVDDLSELVEEQKKEKEATQKGKLPNNVKVILVIVAVAILALALIVVERRNSGETASEGGDGTELLEGVTTGETDTSGGTTSSNGIYDEKGNVIDEDAIDPGITDYYKSDSNSTVEEVYSASDFIKDLNGIDVSAVYNVQSRAYVTDYVNYETRRAIMDDGMELYWLEVVYKEKKYRVQCPFVYFKDLDERGICKVEMEVLTLEGGGKIISYMQVVPDDFE